MASLHYVLAWLRRSGVVEWQHFETRSPGETVKRIDQGAFVLRDVSGDETARAARVRSVAADRTHVASHAVAVVEVAHG